jgi:hypothetical protein
MKPTLNQEELIYVWKELFDISGSVRDVRIEMFGWHRGTRRTPPLNAMIASTKKQANAGGEHGCLG